MVFNQLCDRKIRHTNQDSVVNAQNRVLELAIVLQVLDDDAMFSRLLTANRTSVGEELLCVPKPSCCRLGFLLRVG